MELTAIHVQSVLVASILLFSPPHLGAEKPGCSKCLLLKYFALFVALMYGILYRITRRWKSRARQLRIYEYEYYSTKSLLQEVPIDYAYSG